MAGVTKDVTYSLVVQGLVESYVRSHNPGRWGEGFSLATFKGQEQSFSFSCGNGYSADTPFPLASVSKPILSALVTKLGLDVSLDVKTFFPYLQSRRSISILDLLNQTSGIGEYLYAASEEDLNRWSLREYCDFIQTLPIKETSEYEYSNSNFVLLTQIVEMLGKASYSSQLFSQIVAPAYLKNTFSFEEIEQLKIPFAIPHIWKNDRYERQSIKRSTMGYGDSSLFSSVNDLGLLFASAFKEHIRVATESLDTICPPYSMGLFCKKVESSLVVSHSGSMPGAMSLIVHIPEKDFSLIYLSNYSPTHYEPLVAKFMEAFQIL